MERKGFLTAAMGVAAAVAATGIAATAAPPVGVPPPVVTPPGQPQPRPTSSGWQRGQNHSNRNITRIRKHLERVIDELQHDQHDYGGHRETALDLLQQARAQMLSAEDYESKHPEPQSTTRPI